MGYQCGYDKKKCFQISEKPAVWRNDCDGCGWEIENDTEAPKSSTSFGLLERLVSGLKKWLDWEFRFVSKCENPWYICHVDYKKGVRNRRAWTIGFALEITGPDL